MKGRILISGLGGSLFPYLHNQLEKYYDIYYIDNDESLKYVYKGFKIFEAPLAKSEEYEDYVCEVIEDHNIKFYVPLIDEEILKSLNLRDRYNDLRVLAPGYRFSQMCLDKYDLMNQLSKHNISHINTRLANQSIAELEPPYFLKPVVGRGSRGARIVDTTEDLDLFLKLYEKKLNKWLVQECCSGTEYTVGVLVNNKNQILSIGSRRIIQKRGITISAVNENNDSINKKMHEIVETFQPKGPFNVQLFITPNRNIEIFEINPRFSTTSIMSYEGGVNEIKLYLDNYDNSGPIDIIYPENGVFLKRTWHNNFYR